MTTSQNTHDDAACLRLFAETLERLNDVFSGQMLSILNIATAAADAAKTLEPASTDADAFLEKVKTILDDMKAESAAVGESGSVTHGSGEGKHGTFCEEIEGDINVAILQALSSQQRLNVMGASVLAEGAQLVLNAGAK
jgi:hypothetical protein